MSVKAVDQTKRFDFDRVSLMLRIGLGLVFVSGGLNKLIYFLNPSTSEGMVAKYMGPAGYVNEFFTQYIFHGALENIITPFMFLTALSTLELVFGLMLIVGLLVKPVSLISAFLCWSFVIALPVVTTPNVVLDIKTHTTPALLVMIRDIAISGFFFVLYNIGSGSWSLDRKYLGYIEFLHIQKDKINWDSLALLLRLSLGFVFIVGGFFYGQEYIQSFKTHGVILALLGIAIVLFDIKYLGYLLAAVLFYYLMMKLNFDKGLIGYLNSVKREFALFASALVLGYMGVGHSHIVSLSKRTV